MKTYKGGCHCGKVRYEISTELAKVIECNCSHCEKVGLLLTFVPAEQFKLESGADDLSDYQFNKKRLHHRFCKHCGVKSFSTGERPDGAKTYAINVRCLDGIDITKLERTPYDGRAI